MSWTRQTYLAMTLDPLHVGTGGYRLGRVDNAIVREPGTNMPKVPGTTLSGAARSYAAMRFGKIRCAGQGQPRRDRPDSGHCGQRTCPICYTFGHTVGQGSYEGTVSLYDARIVFFPVATMLGPTWVSTERILTGLGFTITPEGRPEDVADAAGVLRAAGGLDVARRQDGTGALNLGWLMLDVGAQKVKLQAPAPFQGAPELSEILDRAVLVNDGLLAQIVNSNLEVRTSVSINPETGAAQTGALFTYEAVPRATILAFDVVEDNYQEFPSMQALEKWQALTEDQKSRLGLVNNEIADSLNRYREYGVSWRHPRDVALAGLELARVLGLGGMGTRGFGRLALLGDPVEEAVGAQPTAGAGRSVWRCAPTWISLPRSARRRS